MHLTFRKHGFKLVHPGMRAMGTATEGGAKGEVARAEGQQGVMQVKMAVLPAQADVVAGAKKKGIKGIDKKYSQRT